MRILEIYKKRLAGDVETMIKNENGVIFDDENIINAFCGYVYPRTPEEAKKRFYRYMQDNKIFCIYYDLENKNFL